MNDEEQMVAKDGELIVCKINSCAAQCIIMWHYSAVKVTLS